MDIIATPGMTREIIKKYGITVRKSLGQNFLIEQKFIKKVVEAAHLGKDQFVVEIGPGIGGLTQALAKEAGQVVALEIDHCLVHILKEVFAGYANVKVMHGDAMKEDFDQLVKSGDHFPKYKIVANLPYYITTPVIMRLLEGRFNFSFLVLMVQREVAERMMASPGTKAYGALSIGVQYHCIPSLVSLVPPTVFYPRPEVTSAIITLEKRIKPSVEVFNERLFFSLVKVAFSQRRKTLLNTLSHSGLLFNKERWNQVLVDNNIDPQRRGETLSLVEFAALTNYLSDGR